MAMIKPELRRILSEHSVFSTVIAVAKRSRDIAEKAQEDRQSLQDKPVNIAIEELAVDKIRVMDPEELSDPADR